MKNKKKIINKNFSYDSRLVKQDEIFFDFLSDKKKTNPYLDDVIKKNPYLIVTRLKSKTRKPKVLNVQNVQAYYERLIKKKYSNIPKNIFAVTGTNGKTSVVNFVNQIYLYNKIKSATIGTLGFNKNNRIKKSNLTTPSNLEIFKFLHQVKKEKIDNVAIEASSHGLYQKRLMGLKFNTVVFTNFTRDHLDYHKNMKSYLDAKLILFKKHLNKNANIICDENIFKILNKNKITKKNFNFVFQKKNNQTFKLVGTKAIGNKTNLKLNCNNKIYNIKVGLVGKIQIENLIKSIKVCEIQGLKLRSILKVLPKIKAPDGRLNIFEKKNKIICLDYAHTPDGLKKTIMTLKDHFKKDVNLLFGCGGDRDKEKRPQMGLIANKYCKKIYLTNDNPRFEKPEEIINQIRRTVKRAKVLPNRAIAIKKAIVDINKKKEILLIAGKGHETYQIFKSKKKYFSDKEQIKKYL